MVGAARQNHRPGDKLINVASLVTEPVRPLPKRNGNGSYHFSNFLPYGTHARIPIRPRVGPTPELEDCPKSPIATAYICYAALSGRPPAVRGEKTGVAECVRAQPALDASSCCCGTRHTEREPRVACRIAVRLHGVLDWPWDRFGKNRLSRRAHPAQNRFSGYGMCISGSWACA